MKVKERELIKIVLLLAIAILIIQLIGRLFDGLVGTAILLVIVVLIYLHYFRNE